MPIAGEFLGVVGRGLLHPLGLTLSSFSPTEQSRCRVGQISGTYGWWGPRPVFVTTLERCQAENFLPGLHLVTYQHPRNDSQPDKVSAGLGGAVGGGSQHGGPSWRSSSQCGGASLWGVAHSVGGRQGQGKGS